MREERRRIRALILGELERSGMLLGSVEFGELAVSALRLGQRLADGALVSLGGSCAERLAGVGRAVGAPLPEIHRVLGFGAQQAVALAVPLGAPAPRLQEVARWGGLFNMGISLFDRILDAQPARTEALLGRFTPDALARMLDGAGPPPPSGDGVVDLVLLIFAELFAGARRAGHGRPAWSQLERVIREMYRAELYLSYARRSAPADLVVWRQLRRKSALPMATMALLGMLACDRPADDEVTARVRRAALVGGEAVWIIDDIIDVVEDGVMGAWSRPWWIWRRGAPDAPSMKGREADCRRLVDAVVPGEVARLGLRLRRVRDLLPAKAPSLFQQSLQVMVHSWTYSLPE